MSNLVNAEPRSLGEFRVGPLSYGLWRFTNDDLGAAQRLIEGAGIHRTNHGESGELLAEYALHLLIHLTLRPDTAEARVESPFDSKPLALANPADNLAPETIGAVAACELDTGVEKAVLHEEVS